MSYIHEKPDGTAKVHPHKLRAMLKNKISDLLTRYTLDEVLSEIAQQRPTFDIRVSIADSAKGKIATLPASADDGKVVA